MHARVFFEFCLKAEMDTHTYIHTHTAAMLYPPHNKLREGINKNDRHVIPLVNSVNIINATCSKIYIRYMQ